MKKLLKIGGKLIKAYLIWDAICLMWIGIGELYEKYREYPDQNVFESNNMVVRETAQKWKDYFKYLKGES